ncbi:MAG: HYR domain-containing protein [Candidatus Hinthialibacter antarcticus]|nr:HYR domain-containing protein [Candidatus Hinthialibacter antarcticus]
MSNATLTVSDGQASDQGSVIVYVKDTTPPALEDLENITVNAADSSGAIIFYPTPAASDIADPSPIVSATPTSGSLFPFGDTVVYYSATDFSGNVSSASFVVSVFDQIPPQITCQGNIVVEAESEFGTVVYYPTPEAMDNVDPSPIVECNPPSGSLIPVGSTIVNCTATDSSGNASNCSFIVSVTDTTSPDINCPGNIYAEAIDSNGAVVEYSVEATDIVDQDVDVVCIPPSGSVFPIGHNIVTCTATDDYGNSSECSFDIYVDDTTPPIIQCLNDISVEAMSSDGAVVEFVVSASDTVDSEVDVNCTPPSGSVFSLGDTLVQCIASDDAGNSSTCTFVVNVTDTTPPIIVCPGELIVVEAVDENGAIVNYLVTASDIVDQDVELICDPPSVSEFPLGQTTVSCIAIDNSGNSTICEFVVNVIDTTSPVILCPSDIYVEATGYEGSVVEFVVLASDTVDQEVDVSCNSQTGSVFPLGETVVQCIATDDYGNNSTCSFVITVIDTTLPEIDCPENISVEATSPDGVVVEFTVVATDSVDQNVDIVCNPVSGSVFSIGQTTVTCIAVDDFGNQAICSFVVKVTDTTPPQINDAVPDPAEIWPPNNKMIPVTISVDAFDTASETVNCQIISVTSDEEITEDDWEITGDLTLLVRADRDGNGDGRVYFILVECTDEYGNASQEVVEVTIAHDQSGKSNKKDKKPAKPPKK